MRKRSALWKIARTLIPILVCAYLWITPVRAQGSGESVYKTKCASCHGADGKGATPAGKATKARDFCSDEAQKESDDDWALIIAKGKNKMPAYDKKISDADVKSVVAYIRGLCKK